MIIDYRIDYLMMVGFKREKKNNYLLISLGPGLLQSPDFPLPEMSRQSRTTNLLLDTAGRLGPRAIALNADALLPAVMSDD